MNCNLSGWLRGALSLLLLFPLTFNAAASTETRLAAVSFDDQPTLQLQADQRDLERLEQNGGVRRLDDGAVAFSPEAREALLESMVNTSEKHRAVRIVRRNGVIELSAAP